MRPQFPSGPATRSALYLLGLLAALKALSLVLMGQAVASMLAGLAGARTPAWAGPAGLGRRRGGAALADRLGPGGRRPAGRRWA